MVSFMMLYLKNKKEKREKNVKKVWILKSLLIFLKMDLKILFQNIN
jgi:hypothetical protein